MWKTERSIAVHRSIEDVFGVVTDVTQTGRWFPGNVEEYWLTPPPPGVGSIRHAVVVVMGRRSENDATVVEYDPPWRGTMEGQKAGMRWTVTIACRPEADATRLAMTFAVSASWWTRLFVGPLLAWHGKSWGIGLANLKKMMEAGELEPPRGRIGP